jgi:diguanylate cyclase (GGDEF)-like protein/PAS domain S-box-containing protein
MGDGQGRPSQDAAAAEREDDPAVLARLLDASPHLTFLLDSEGTVVWVSAAVERIFGYQPDELIGTNILTHVDSTWEPGALASIGEAFAADGLRLPTVFRALRKDGSTLICEVWANSQMQDPVLNGMVVQVRRWDERVLLDRAFESLAAGEPLEHTLRVLVEVMGCETLEAGGVILHGPVGTRGQRVEAAPGLPDELVDLTDAGASPWQQAITTSQPQAARVAELPPPIRAAASAAGFDLCWAWPVVRIPDDVGDVQARGVDACIVAWRSGEEVEPDYTRVQLLDGLARMARLAFERARTQARLEHAATTDPLTQLANRARFYDSLEAAASTAGGGQQVGVLYLDLDGFKPVNDQLGHGVGDEVLAAVARRLTGAVREGDVVARLGGDEFAVLCPALASAEELGSLAARLVDVVAEPFEVRGEQVRLGVSVGASLAPVGASSGDQLVEAADRALYEVKGAGKGGWRLTPAIPADA